MLPQFAPQQPANGVKGMVVVGLSTVTVESEQGDAEEPLPLDEPVAGDCTFQTPIFCLKKEFHLGVF